MIFLPFSFSFVFFSLLLFVIPPVPVASYVAVAVSLDKNYPLSTYNDLVSEALRSDPSFDVIVFPELGFDQPFDEPEVIGNVGDIPCSEYNRSHSPRVVSMSCTAQHLKRYIVIGLVELGENCTKASSSYCYNNKWLVYNVAVVFDREGSLVAKYRKHHITGPPFAPAPPVPTFFDTDFGVRFGLFICYDIMFRDPSETLVVHHQITDILFPTQWQDVMPGTALPIQQSWSEFFGVNFIASNVDDSSIGSGIWTQGQLVAQTVDRTRPQLLFATLPTLKWTEPPSIPPLPNKVPFKTEIKKDLFWAIGDLERVYSFNLSTIDCQVSFRVAEHEIGEFFVAVGAKVLEEPVQSQSLDVLYCGLSVCGIDPLKCLKDQRSWTRFEHVRIDMWITGDDVRIVQAMASSDGMRPFANGQWDIHHHGLHQWMESTSQLNETVLNAGLLGVLNEDTE